MSAAGTEALSAQHGRVFVLVPGAWMGGWAWQSVAELLGERGHRAFTPTLAGLDGAADHSQVRLADHVDQVVALLDAEDLRDVILVGHSYSGLVVGQVADRRPERVAHSVFVQAFLPQHGRSLIDDWGDDDTARAEERATIAARGRWEPPTAGLVYEPDLTDAQRHWLAANFVDHPRHTVTDAAVMRHPVQQLEATFIACVPTDNAAVPAEITALGRNTTWTVSTITAGHWPMVSIPQRLADLLHQTATRAARLS